MIRLPSQRFPKHDPLCRILPLIVLLLILSGGSALAVASSSGDANGSYPGRVLDEILRHRQSELQRARLGIQTQRTAQPSASVDIGEIAVLEDDGTLVTVANIFDLDQKNLLFQPATGGYTVLAGAGGFDPAAAAQGILLNPPPASNPQNIGDDGTRLLPIGFTFPFFGTSYTSLFVNSDGNLTFGAGDFASTARSLGRFLAGPPRIAPFFADLDPSVAGQLTYLSTPTRFVVTWSQVPDFAFSGIGPRETFQVSLTPDGQIQFSYSGINGREAVVGISPGGVAEAPGPQDLSIATGNPPIAGAIAEVFTPTTELDLVAVARRFYQTHEDTYQILFFFTTFDFNLGGAFAFEINIANDATGIGLLGPTPTFDYSDEFGSARLESILNMGNLSKYPADPGQVFLRGVDSTLSVMGQEAGHRFLTYARFRDPETNLNSTALLGRDLQHWSFYFNSDASVMEGNRIRDNGDGTFTTIGAVQKYNDFDQYLMGLRAPEDVSPSFLVKNPSLGFSAGAAPTAQQLTFSGRRVDVTVDQIIAANGPRVPNHVTARKRYNYAFILVTPRGTQATDSQVAQLNRIRQDWEPFYAQATSFRSVASTSLLRALQLNPGSMGLIPGTQRQVSIELSSPTVSNLLVQVANSNPAAVSAPVQVLVQAGTSGTVFSITALNAAGSLNASRAVISATAPGFETADVVIQVASSQTAGFTLGITGGNNQVGLPGSFLPQPLQVLLADTNRITYPGQNINFSVIEGDATVTPATTSTDAAGRAAAVVRFGSAAGPVRVRADVAGTGLSVDFSLSALAQPEVPPLGTLNAASHALNPASQPVVATSSPGALISISGTSLAAVTTWPISFPLPKTLGGTSVLIDGTQAPLLYVSPALIHAQVPYELSTGVLTLRVRNAVSDSTPIAFSVLPAFPGIFTFDASGTGPGVILHNASGLPVTSRNPAVPGEIIRIFATGLGPVAPAVVSGQPAGSQPRSATLLPTTVTVNGVPATVIFAGLAPGYAGLYEVDVEVPQVAPGTAELMLSVNGVASQKVAMATGSN